eukprot:TRINITY_DN6995_c0_g1_i1.p1 TRINITY_DN6995_c0_g1~~TRINITY_DN6995_c0_g1_i1.p1  ORF type:complete len:275 (+),score=61.04 TRINITY_DN6995_c0_g1_i1:172-996(+)
MKKIFINVQSPNKVRGQEPANYRQAWDKIVEMRKQRVAPVDMMGCDALADGVTDPKERRYGVLVSLMLSSQTKDPVTAAAMSNLRKHGLTVDNILKTDDGTLDALINKVGFHRRKTQYIKKTTQILKDDYAGDIPETIEGIMQLPGIGPKMATLIMTSAWNKTVGIGVDVHVHRISNRLGWVDTDTPEQTRLALEDWLEYDRWSTINKLLVGFGQTICVPVGPKCDQCTINDICPSAFKKTSAAKKKGGKRKKKVKSESESEEEILGDDFSDED